MYFETAGDLETILTQWPVGPAPLVLYGPCSNEAPGTQLYWLAACGPLSARGETPTEALVALAAQRVEAA